MENENSDTASVALIVGVTGMVGLSLAEALKKPNNNNISGVWKVCGIARRPLPDWYPSSLVDHFISVDALDHNSTVKKLSPIAIEVTHVFWVALQVHASEEVNVTMNSLMLANVLDVLKSASPSRLQHVTLKTGTQHYMGPIHGPELANHLVHHEPPFKEEFPRLPYPNFYYALEDLLSSYCLPSNITYSVHRATIIIGASSVSTYNTLLTLSVYATICRYKGLPFKYPGTKYTWEHFCDMADAGVLAEQHIWAAVTEKAKNQAFNCSNGDVFTWKSLWKVLCEIFGVKFVEFDENDKFDWAEIMRNNENVWDEIVEKYGLFKTKMEDITCFEALNTVLHFRMQHLCSMNKSREMGFFGFSDTFKSVRVWIQRLKAMNIIP